jgi:hypothetical protein
MSKALRIYIAGPYTAQGKNGPAAHTKKAIEAGIAVFAKGHYPYIPHLTHYVDLRARQIGRKLTWSDYITWDLPWLDLCDALLYLGKSRGADIELERAAKLKKKIFFSLSEISKVKRRKPATLSSSVERK